VSPDGVRPDLAGAPAGHVGAAEEDPAGARPEEPRPRAALLPEGGRLEACTSLTIQDPRVLAVRLERVGAVGHALDEGEYAPDVRCVAVPVRDYGGRVIAAPSVSGPTARMVPRRVGADLLPRPQAAAVTLSRRLGYGRAA